MELERTFDDLRAIVEDPSFPAVRRWLAANPEGKVAGHFQVFFPEEVAHAAGLLPVKIAGGGGTVQARQADARIAAFVCSIMVVPNICDAARNGCAVWARSIPGVRVETLYHPQNTRSAHAVSYLAQEYRRIGRVVEEVAGRRVTDHALRQSIAVFNENRRLLREVYRIKRETPWLLSAVESYLLVRSAGLMPREEHNRLLRRVLELLPERPAKKQDRVRVVFEGGFCEQPPLDMLAVIQDACYVVDDDLMIGLRWIAEEVPLEGDPWWNLAQSYIERSSYSPVQRDPRKPKPEMLLRRMRESGAEAAIVAAAKMCEPGLEEQVHYSRTLDAAGIPHLVIEFEETMTVFEQVGMEVETFAESLLFQFD